MSKPTAKNIFEDVVIRKGYDLYLEDKLYQNGVEVTGRPYKVYTALLTQEGTNAPTAVVLENTLGADVVWTRRQAGAYELTCGTLFTLNKTFFAITPITYGYWIASAMGVGNVGEVYTINASSNDGEDDILMGHCFEVRVYS